MVRCATPKNQLWHSIVQKWLDHTCLIVNRGPSGPPMVIMGPYEMINIWLSWILAPNGFDKLINQNHKFQSWNLVVTYPIVSRDGPLGPWG